MGSRVERGDGGGVNSRVERIERVDGGEVKPCGACRDLGVGDELEDRKEV